MAIADNSTSAYTCHLDRNDKLIMEPITGTRDLCVDPGFAAVEIAHRKMVIVAESDVDELHRLVAQFATTELI